MDGDEVGCSSRAIDSSNVGFQLLKKFGWKEGTGLGVSEQGRLEPVQTHIKKDKRGLGAEKTKQKMEKIPNTEKQNEHENLQSRKKLKSVSKRIRKMQEEEERLKEKEFERAFFREFWPDNV